jgi:Transcriptional regulator
MPRISAPTVAEHRAAQRAALVRAGEAELLESGLAGVTPRSVCERAGLSRSSFYDYFPSRDDLLVAIAIDAIERWAADLDEALEAAEPGLPELRAYVDAVLRMTAEGRHKLADALRDAPLSPSSLDGLMVLHDTLLRPVHRVLRDLGIPDSMTTATLVQSVLGAGVQLVSHGADPRAVGADVFGLLTRGILPTS